MKLDCFINSIYLCNEFSYFTPVFKYKVYPVCSSENGKNGGQEYS